MLSFREEAADARFRSVETRAPAPTVSSNRNMLDYAFSFSGGESPNATSRGAGTLRRCGVQRHPRALAENRAMNDYCTHSNACADLLAVSVVG